MLPSIAERMQDEKQPDSAVEARPMPGLGLRPCAPPRRSSR